MDRIAAAARNLRATATKEEGPYSEKTDRQHGNTFSLRATESALDSDDGTWYGQAPYLSCNRAHRPSVRSIHGSSLRCAILEPDE